MIPEKIHNELMEKWQGRKYATRERIEKRLHHLELLLPLLKGKNVLELGSNSGITAYDICKYSKSYAGVEPDKDYHEQAQLMESYLPDTAHFMNGTLLDYINVALVDPNAFVMCIALYLLSKEEVSLLEEKIFPKCEIVIIQERTAKRPSMKKYNPLKLHKPKNIRNLLVKNGFDTDIYFSTKEKYFEVIGVNKGICRQNRAF